MAGCKWFSFLLVSVVIISCGKNVPELKGIDLARWASDKNACAGERIKMIPSLQQEKDKLLALNELQVVEILGRPDQNELYKRNQKFYYYFLQPSSGCSPGGNDSALRLVIRFNAMG